jgi:site-specific recombinase XerD
VHARSRGHRLVDDALATITQIEESGVIEQIDQAATALTPENAALLVELSPTITKLADNSEAITKLAEKVGIEGVSSHSFRRSALTAAHQAGLSLREVAEISGHRSLAALGACRA